MSVERAYRVCCDVGGCNACTRFTTDRAEALRDAKADGYRYVRLSPSVRVFACAACAARLKTDTNVLARRMS